MAVVTKWWHHLELVSDEGKNIPRLSYSFSFVTTRIPMGKVLFSQVSVCSHWGGGEGVPTLNAGGGGTYLG